MEVDRPIKSANEECNSLHDQSIKVRDQNISRDAPVLNDAIQNSKSLRGNENGNSRTLLESKSDSSNKEQSERHSNNPETRQTQDTECSNIQESQDTNSNDDITLDSMKISEDEEAAEEDVCETPTISCKKESEKVPENSQVEDNSDQVEGNEEKSTKNISVGDAKDDLLLSQRTESHNEEDLEINEDSDENEDDHKLSDRPQIQEEYQDYHALLFEALNGDLKKAKPPRKPVVNLEVSTNILSYERFYPGRILGNTFALRNTGDKPASFTIDLDNSTFTRTYISEKLCDYFGTSNINDIDKAYTKYLKKEYEPSKENLDVWYIEDPFSKKLTKKVQMTLNEGEEYEFIVVLKSATINKQTFYAANAVVNCDEAEKELKVFCFGCMESLKVGSPKEMYNQELGSKMIKVVMRRRQQAQAIKLLLENKGEMEVNTSFQSMEMEKDLQFYIPRDKVRIEPHSKALLEIKAIHKLGPKGGKDSKPEIIHKLVIARVKDCELKFSFIFEITII